MSVSLATWLQPLVFTSEDDRETGEILAECNLTNLADAYEYLYAAWQQPSALNLLTSLQILHALQHLHWLEQAETAAWQNLFAHKTQQLYPQAQLFLQELSATSLSTVKLQRIEQANLSNWELSWNSEFNLHNLALQQIPPALQVRKDPLGFALAVRSSSFVMYQQSLECPKRLQEKFWPDVKATLNEYWQVHSRQDCLQLLYWLAGQGQRYAWQLDAAWLDQATETDKEVWLQELPPDQQDYAQLLLNQPPAWQPNLAAWDWVRMADLALASYLAGYLDADEWRVFGLTAVWLLRKQYASWQEVAHSYLLGYQFWQTQTDFSLSPQLENTWEHLLNCPLSPLQQLDWHNLSLDHPDFKPALTKFSIGLNQPFMLASLLASIRDESCLLTGLAPLSLHPERQQEAEDYLVDHLEVTPQENLNSCLTRFWQPGRVHHYDQLALNARIEQRPKLASNLTAVPEIWHLWQRQLQGLKSLANQPAAIVMAEKYAFNLVKAQESGLFKQQEIDQLSLALTNYLHWHYASATKLIKAWHSWDKVLTLAEEEKPLSNELHWHLHDAGSLFNFLPWAQAEQSFIEPGRQVSELELAMLNLVGPLTGIHWSWPEQLPATPAQEIKQILQETHYITEVSELNEYLDFLYKSGDRQDFIINFAPFSLNAKHLNNEIAVYAEIERSSEDENYYQRLLQVKYNTLGINDVDLTAWDMTQLVDLAVTGYQVGWLTEAELKQWLELVAQELMLSYSGWDTFAAALLAGYNFFMQQEGEKDEVFSVFGQRLLSLLIAVPPQVGLWYTLAWPSDRNRAWEQAALVLPTTKPRLH